MILDLRQAAIKLYGVDPKNEREIKKIANKLRKRIERGTLKTIRTGKKYEVDTRDFESRFQPRKKKKPERPALWLLK